MMVRINKFIKENENSFSVFLTILALIFIGIFGKLYFIGFFIFIFLGFKIILSIFQIVLLILITEKQEKLYEEKLKQRSKEKDYRETRVGLNISKRAWNKYSTERKNNLIALYSGQKRVIWNNFRDKNPNINVTYNSSKYFNLISEANKSLEWRNISEDERISLIEKYDRLQYQRLQYERLQYERLQYERQKDAILKEDNKREQILKEQKKQKISGSNESDFSFKFLKYAGILLIFFMLFTCGSRKRVGAICKDGTSSYSTGSGTCSYHNGVRSWKYEYWWD